mmetsp:Transcript_98317/g.147425  ORF Transcript_98317/g.147425 Transcript_98317/m.147425 type:complete len:81 (-) Transcript_98317:6396-6638(-)
MIRNLRGNDSVTGQTHLPGERRGQNSSVFLLQFYQDDTNRGGDSVCLDTWLHVQHFRMDMEFPETLATSLPSPGFGGENP